MNFSPTKWLTIIIVTAIALRVAAALYLGNTVVDMPGTFDQVSYDMLARQVLNGRGFTVAENWWPNTPAGRPTAHWSYFYTLYLVAVYKLFGYAPLAARLIQAVLAGFLTPWLVYRLGCRFFNSKIGLIGAGLAAVYAYFVYYAATLMTETFYIIAILWVFNLAARLGNVPEESSDPPPNLKIYWVWLGLAMAITGMLRQVILPFLPILYLWVFWRNYRRGLKQVWPLLATLCAAGLLMLLLFAPFTIRNYRAFNRFVLLNTNAGYAFFWGNHPIYGYKFIPILPDTGPSYQDLIPADLQAQNLNEAELDQALLQRGLGFVTADPARYLILSLSRIEEYIKFWPSRESGLISNISRVASWGILWPFMLYGLIYYLRPPRFSPALALLYLFVVVYTGIHLLSWTLIRYRLPVDAILLLFAGAACADLQRRLQTYRVKKSE